MSVDDREAGRLAGLREARAYVEALLAMPVHESSREQGQRRMARRVINGIDLLMREPIVDARQDAAGVGG